ncbi:MAG: histidine kinase [Microbacteriaceae bacterium]|nr:histidine kinase [Microbacteriaceae bacterium]MCL2794029.1 histidine kinase [Microbacteriaceae bacterium]
MTPAVRAAVLRWGLPVGTLVVNIIAVASELAAAGTAMPRALGAYAAAVVTAALLIWGRSRPFTVCLAILAVSLAHHLAGYPGQGPAFALFPAVFLLGSEPRPARSLPLAVAVATAWAVIPTLPPHPVAWTDWGVLGPALGMCIVAVSAVAIGASARQVRAEHAAETAELRAAVARDIHDVLAHTVAAIGIQTTLALDAIDDDPDLAKESMRRARELARGAAPQLRTALLQLREDERPEQPQPTLALLDAVLDEARAAGFEVERRIRLETGMIDPVTELTFARVGQEAVTNAIRHSGGRRLRCVLEARGGEAVLEVADDGSRLPGPEGLGIAGMRERAAAIGGRLETGPGPTGGFLVRATIPLRARRGG